MEAFDEFVKVFKLFESETWNSFIIAVQVLYNLYH
jgi:hypothetical protein